MIKHFQKLISILLLFTVACDSSDEQKIQKDETYFPLQTGQFRIYDIEETIYTLGTPVTKTYQLKTVVSDSFPNTEGTYTYVIHRSTRMSDQAEWQIEGTWSARKNQNEAVVYEENTPFVVLHFPIKDGLKWNGNKYNTVINPATNTNEDTYTVEEKGTSHVVNDLTFSDCVVVNQEDNQEFIVFLDKRTEIYARHIGLVYKEITQLSYCNDQDRNCIGQQIVDSGIIYTQQIKAYGQE